MPRRLALALLLAPAATLADIAFDFTLASAPTVTFGYIPGSNTTNVVETWDVANPQPFPAPAGQTGNLVVTLHTPTGTRLVVPTAFQATDIVAEWSRNGAVVLAARLEPFALLGAQGAVPSLAFATDEVAGATPSTLTSVNLTTNYGANGGAYSLTGAQLVSPIVSQLPSDTTGPPFNLAAIQVRYDLPGVVTTPPAALTFLQTTAVPEPSALTMAGLATAGAALAVWRRRRV